MAERLTPHTRALLLACAALALELLAILPFTDHLADSNSMVHFTQHGAIFAGGVMMGFALRGLQD
jgi:hypothetical protein